MIDYNNRKFKVVGNSESGDVSNDLIFHYQQVDNILTCTYDDKQILSGHLIGLVDEDGRIDMRYHQVSSQGIIKTGKCVSTPSLQSNGKLRLHEMWEWLSGDTGNGESFLEEI